ncbi:hypothetical protein ELQ92_11935 [Labedella populi]|uniref:Uncharacterized protein n=1 Tax=Labedella populi TaxID=2498850 RepID=A0A444Q6L4_9MICO|nr:hypothetical protein [Labedella populi]RWZ59536.1 hypothetical protein ELQ92_11935 [Labedella populi]
MSDYSSPSPEDEITGSSVSGSENDASESDTTDENISTDPMTEEDTDSGGAPEEPDVTNPA